MKKYLSLGSSSLIAAINFYRKYKDVIGSMTNELAREKRWNIEVAKKLTNTQIQVHDLTEQLQKTKKQLVISTSMAAESVSKYSDKIDSCPCPTCKLVRKFPNYGYIIRVNKAIDRGDAS